MTEKSDIDSIKKSFIGQEALHSGRITCATDPEGGEMTITCAPFQKRDII